VVLSWWYRSNKVTKGRTNGVHERSKASNCNLQRMETFIGDAAEPKQQLPMQRLAC
jgi:hypothetical protein